MPGAMTRKPREKWVLLGERTAFTVCHAISIAITVVLPAPVAIFMARRSNSGLACSLAPENVFPDMGILLFVSRHFRQPDDGFDGLHLTEEWAYSLKLIAAPIIEQARRGGRNAPCGRI